MRFFSRNKELLILFVIALALRVFLVFTARGIATDGCSYAWLAENIASGNLHQVVRSILPPLFPVFTAAASYVFQDIELSARMVSCLFGSLTVFPLFFLVNNIFDRKTALVTVLFFVVHPYLTQASAEVLTEALYYFFLTSSASLAWIALHKRNTLLFSGVGILLSLTFLTRFEGFFLILLVLAWIWLTNLPMFKTEFRWKLTSSFACILAFFIPLSPYIFFVSKQAGKLQVSSRQQHYETTFFKPTSTEQTPLQKLAKILQSKLSNSPPRIPFFFAKAYYPVFLAPFFFGLIGRRRFSKFKMGELYIFSFILFRLIVLVVFAGINTRLLFAFIPIALSWAGVGFWEIDHRLQERYKEKSLVIGGYNINLNSIIVLAIIVAICLPRALRPIRSHRAVQKEAGYWLKEHAGQKNFVVVAPSLQESFYAGAKWHLLKGKTYKEIINNAREQKADFLIVNKDIDEICPDFIESIRTEHLEIFTKKFENSSKKIVIYKLK
jgi:4-amino-4-deoxy-L-arabinose transferase-like glycosyltransferase